MFTMEEESFEEGDLVEQAYVYVTSSRYPTGCPENRKRVIRKKAKKFEVKDGVLYYKKKCKGKVLLAHLSEIYN